MINVIYLIKFDRLCQHLFYMAMGKLRRRIHEQWKYLRHLHVFLKRIRRYFACSSGFDVR